jgi:hypothetical protein
MTVPESSGNNKAHSQLGTEVRVYPEAHITGIIKPSNDAHTETIRTTVFNLNAPVVKSG